MSSFEKVLELDYLDIEVTEQHIRDGGRKSCSACPVALAVMSALADYELAVLTTWGMIYVLDHLVPSTVVKTFRSEPEVGNFIVAFDSGLPVAPFKARLTAYKVTHNADNREAV